MPCVADATVPQSNSYLSDRAEVRRPQQERQVMPALAAALGAYIGQKMAA